MKVDLVILQIAVLFLPGLIWARLDVYYASKVKPSETEFFLRAFIFGLTAYAVTFLIYSAAGWPFAIIDLKDAATKTVVTREMLKEILWAVGVGLVLAVVRIYSSTYKWLTRFLQFIRATKKYGDEDVWDFIFNSPIAAVEYVHFRDFANSLVYAGWVRQFSETENYASWCCVMYRFAILAA